MGPERVACEKFWPAGSLKQVQIAICEPSILANTPADKFALGSRRLGRHYNYTVMAEPLKAIPRPAQLRDVKP